MDPFLIHSEQFSSLAHPQLEVSRCCRRFKGVPALILRRVAQNSGQDNLGVVGNVKSPTISVGLAFAGIGDSAQPWVKSKSGEVAQDAEGLLLGKRLQSGGSDVALRCNIEHESRIGFVVRSLNSYCGVVRP